MSELNLALAHYRRQEFAAATSVLETAREVRRLGKEEVILLIRLHLLAGDQRRGWELLAESCRDGRFAPPLYTLPRFTGQALAGKRFVVWGGSGFGDEILYSRYLPALSDLGADVWLQSDPALVDLFRSLRGERCIRDLHDRVAGADYQMSTAELPAYFRAEPCPYLHADPLPLPPDGFRIGIAWAADSRHLEAKDRTADLDDLACIGAVPGVRLYNLQVGECAARLNSPPPGMIVRPLSVGFPTFAAQARQIMGLDLVITVDTAIANLAGALGARAWVAVPHLPDWRWGLTGVSTPWYPSVRVYRQPVAGDWRTVFATMARDMAAGRLG